MPLDQFSGAIDGFGSAEHFGLLDRHGEALPVQGIDLRQRIHAFGARVDEDAARPRECPKMRSEEHTSELQSLMRISYAVFCLKKKKKQYNNKTIKTKTQ